MQELARVSYSRAQALFGFPMVCYFLKRLLWTIPVLWAMTTVVFFLVRLAPGGPFDLERPLSPEVRGRLNAHYGLDQPILSQYFRYVAGVVRGDLGPSFTSTFSVNERILSKFPVSLELGLYALAVAILLGLAAGLVAASKPNSLRDYVVMSAALAGISIPSLVMGPLLVLVFGLWLGWFDVAGWSSGASKILPALTLGLGYAAYIARLCRGGMLEVMTQDFIRTARAKGMSEARVVLRHGLRAGIMPVVAYLGPAAAGLLTGSFIVEQIFQIPGLGTEFVRSASNRDYTMVLGTVLFYGVLILFFNILVDLAQAFLDPRQKEGRKARGHG